MPSQMPAGLADGLRLGSALSPAGWGIRPGNLGPPYLCTHRFRRHRFFEYGALLYALRGILQEGFSVKPLIGGVEGWDADIDDAELAHGPVTAERLDQNGAEGSDGDDIAIQFHVARAFEDEVYLRVVLVVVHLRILLNIDDMNRGSVIIGQSEGPPDKSAGTPHRVRCHRNEPQCNSP